MSDTYDVVNCRHLGGGNSPHMPGFGQYDKKAYLRETNKYTE